MSSSKRANPGGAATQSAATKPAHGAPALHVATAVERTPVVMPDPEDWALEMWALPARLEELAGFDYPPSVLNAGRARRAGARRRRGRRRQDGGLILLWQRARPRLRRASGGGPVHRAGPAPRAGALEARPPGGAPAAPGGAPGGREDPDPGDRGGTGGAVFGHAGKAGVHGTPALDLGGIKADFVQEEGGPEAIALLVRAHQEGQELPATPAALDHNH